MTDAATWHPTFEQLSDLADPADGEPQDAHERARVAHHVTTCGACRDRVAAIRALLGEAAGAPRSVEPPDDLWPSIRSELERRKVVALPSARAGVMARHPGRVVLAAAAVTLVMTSSALTATIMNARASRALVARVAERQETHVLPASLVATEASYLRTAQQLETALNEQRSRLSPATIATVEHSLRVIDQAIAEAREALVRDPGNQALVDMFATNYERKLDLLRRATELAPRT